MTVSEVFDEQPTITRKQAIATIADHSSDWSEFAAEMGDKEAYNGAEVLAWLGY